MLASYLALPLFALLLPAGAAPTSRAHRWSKIIPVTANSTGKMIPFSAPAATPGITEIVIQAFAPNPLNIGVVPFNASTISGTFNISAHAYIPANPSTTCFFATHGIGADATWWDFKVPGDNNSYSFVDAANAQGYPVFSYDRLGTGKSERPDGLQVVQSTIQVSIAHELAQQVRKGAIPNLKCEKLVGLGHSFGTVITEGVTAQYGNEDFDAVVLTGTAASVAGEAIVFNSLHSTFARLTAHRFRSIVDNAYYAWDSAIAGHIGFLHYAGLTELAAERFEATKETYTLGEFITLADIVAPSPVYSGPVSVVTGQQDAIACAANCLGGPNGTSLLDGVAALYPKVTHFNTTIIPNTGHGITTHLSAAKAYADIVSWTKGLGL